MKDMQWLLQLNDFQTNPFSQNNSCWVSVLWWCCVVYCCMWWPCTTARYKVFCCLDLLMVSKLCALSNLQQKCAEFHIMVVCNFSNQFLFSSPGHCVSQRPPAQQQHRIPLRRHRRQDQQRDAEQQSRAHHHDQTR